MNVTDRLNYQHILVISQFDTAPNAFDGVDLKAQQLVVVSRY